MVRTGDELEDILRRTVSAASERIPLTTVYLFGSYAEGTAHEDSDIDIAIFSPAADDMSLTQRIQIKSEIRLAVGVDKEVELHLFGLKCLSNARPSNLYGHILATGRKIA